MKRCDDPRHAELMAQRCVTADDVSRWVGLKLKEATESTQSGGFTERLYRVRKGIRNRVGIWRVGKRTAGRQVSQDEEKR